MSNILEFKKPKGETVDGFTLNCIRENAGSPFLLTGLTEDEDVLVPVGDCMPAEEYLLSLTDARAAEAARVAVGVASALRYADRHMLLWEGIILNTTYIYIESKTLEVKLIALPFRTPDVYRSSPAKLLSEIMSYGFSVNPGANRNATDVLMANIAFMNELEAGCAPDKQLKAILESAYCEQLESLCESPKEAAAEPTGHPDIKSAIIAFFTGYNDF